MRNLGLFAFLLICSVRLMAQSSSISGKVVNQANEEAVPFATIFVQATESGAITDEEGVFQITGLMPGLYNLECSALGYNKVVVYEVEVTPDRPAVVQVQLKMVETELDAAVITESAVSSREEAPLSVRLIGVNEIKRNPGGNRDISRTIRALPGVTFIPSFRNDIVIRGGAPSENRFFIDGIEIPTINHFATQGASGGPVGLINVDLINEVEFYSASFPASRGNVLSSVLEMGFRDPRSDKYTANLVVGSSDVGLTLDGPVGKNSGLILSIRRSYLQFLFDALGLPFLPTYNDAQFKYKWRIGERDQLSILGLGAVDNFALNLSLAGDTTSPDFERNTYLLDNLVVNEQWNYTIGAKWDHFTDHGRWSLILSRNALQNNAFKNQDNNESLPRTFDYSSRETENKIRLERKYDHRGWKFVGGIQIENALYDNSSMYSQFSTMNDSTLVIGYFTQYSFNKAAAYSQLSRTTMNQLLTWSVGLRTDMADYSASLNNPLKQLSPRAALRYSFLPEWSLNLSAGIYYQLPSYITLGYQDATGFTNLDARYIQNIQYVAGVERQFDKSNTTVSVEFFHKNYFQYPVSTDKGISLANLGADFGVVGNEDISSIGKGRAQGVEFFVQRKLYKNVFGILAYTIVKSEFTGTDGQWRPSAWDSRHLVSLTGGYRLPRNWELGARFQFSSGLPYTPDDVASSVRIENWERLGMGIPDWSSLNSERIQPFYQLDIRVDKKWFFSRWSLDAYLDIQNVFSTSTPLKPILDVERDENGVPIQNAEMKGSYIPRFIADGSGTLLPSIGLIIEL